MLKNILKKMKKIYFQKQFKKNNQHNDVKLKIIGSEKFDINKISVGNYSYGVIEVNSFGNTDISLKIGNFCSIANGTYFLLSGEHDYKTITTYPMLEKFDGRSSKNVSKGDIILEDDVWVGQSVIILSGVKIGKGSVVGAGSVVAKDIPPYSIYVQGEIIKKRFSDDIVQELEKIDFSKMSEEKIKKNIMLFEEKITRSNYKDIASKFIDKK